MAKSKVTTATVTADSGAVKQRRARRADPTAEVFPEFAAGVERAKRVRAILRKLADWPAADVALLVTALRERADPATGGWSGKSGPVFDAKTDAPPGWNLGGTMTNEAGQPPE